jgi:vacuolar protein sorting-associated protein VTA1
VPENYALHAAPRAPSPEYLAPSPPTEPIRQHDPNNPAPPGDVSPLEPSPQEQGGDGYFPDVPTFTSGSATTNQPTAPPVDDFTSSPPPEPSVPDLPPSAQRTDYPTPRGFTQTNTPHVTTQSYHAPPSHPHAPVSGYSQQPPQLPYQAPAPSYPQASYGAAPSPVSVTPPVSGNDGNPNASEEAILKAQKHCKWAISALNFEDVATAVKELRGALETLGAR